MSTIAIVTKEHGTDTINIVRLLEDIWLCGGKDAELQIEVIIEVTDGEPLNKIELFLDYEIKEPVDLSSLYLQSRFVDGYARCWSDVYQELTIERTGQIEQVLINGLRARVAKASPSLLYNVPRCGDIEISFDPPVSNGLRIFRLGLVCSNFISGTRKWLLPGGAKSFSVYTYGISAFAGSVLEQVLNERQITRENICAVRNHILQVNILNSLEIAGVMLTPTKSYPMQPCHIVPRFCPPLERIAKRENTSVERLKKLGGHYLMWEWKNTGATGGTNITTTYVTSRMWKWVTENWLPILAVLLAIVSIVLTILLTKS